MRINSNCTNCCRRPLEISRNKNWIERQSIKQSIFKLTKAKRLVTVLVTARPCQRLVKMHLWYYDDAIKCPKFEAEAIMLGEPSSRMRSGLRPKFEQPLINSPPWPHSLTGNPLSSPGVRATGSSNALFIARRREISWRNYKLNSRGPGPRNLPLRLFRDDITYIRPRRSFELGAAVLSSYSLAMICTLTYIYVY